MCTTELFCFTEGRAPIIRQSKSVAKNMADFSPYFPWQLPLTIRLILSTLQFIKE
jgi:hypothetical protein